MLDETQIDPAGFRSSLGAWGGALADSLNEVPSVAAYFKDCERRFVWCSDALLRLVGVEDRREVVGFRDEDFAPPDLAAEYRSHEERVLAEGLRLNGLIELVRRPREGSTWYLSTKTPVRSPDGAIVGLVGVNRPLIRNSTSSDTRDSMLRAATYISANVHRRITVSALAGVVSMSPRQFSRSFKRRFDVTPHEYVRRFRIAAASDMLVTSNHSISSIASATGFADQSHLSNEFARFRSMTPSEYRRRFAGS